jgi:hypothetical protein
MPLTLKFDRSGFAADRRALTKALRRAGEKGMAKVVKQAETDAKAVYSWRRPGTYTVQYPGAEWTWTVTGMAAASITGYVVPNKRLNTLATIVTTSYKNGVPLQHPHFTDNAVTGDVAEEENMVIGVVTMNVAYAPYLQDYEMQGGDSPVVVEVFEMNWERVYIPSLAATIEAEMALAAQQFT